MHKIRFIVCILAGCFLSVPARADKEVHLSFQEGLTLASQLSAKGKKDEAREIYALLAQSPDLEIQIEAVFQLAGMAVSRGDFNIAIKYLDAIIKRHPDLSRVRLELARAYFLNGDYQEAQFHFQFVRATSDLPQEVSKKVDEFLAQIRQRKNWTLDFGFGIIPDSNINYSGTSADECINTVFGYLCRPLETAKSGVGLRLNTEGNYFLRFTKRFGLRTTLGLNMLDFPGSDFDDSSIYFASGPRYVFDRGEISLQPTVMARWYGGDFYNYSYGLRLDTNWQLSGRWLLGTGATLRQNHFHKAYIDDALGGHDWGLYLRPRYYVDNKSFIMFGFGFDQNNAKIETFGSNNISYSLGYFGEFQYGFVLFGRVDLITSKYHAPRWVVIDEAFIEKTRSDLTWQFYTRVSNNKLSWYNIVPAISYTYTTRDSNIPNHVFDKHRIEMELIRRF